MKVEFYTEKKYNSYLIGEYEFQPIHNMGKTEEIHLMVSDITKHIPSTFKNMHALLMELDKDFQAYAKEHPNLANKYMNSGRYILKHNEDTVEFYDVITVVHKTREFGKDSFMENYCVPENDVLKLTIYPKEYSTNANDTYYESDSEYLYSDYEQDYYSGWNQYNCDTCESYGHCCKICKNI